MDESGKAQQKKYFSETAPESMYPGRQLQRDLPERQTEKADWPGMTGAELRLHVWSGLPKLHRVEVCKQIRYRCDAFISSVGVEMRQRQSEIDRLVSEVVAHLLRATSTRVEETPQNSEMPGSESKVSSAVAQTIRSLIPSLDQRTINERDPARDGRVSWIINDTCTRQALFHRYEDMRRRDRGGKWDGTGYPLVAVDEQTMEQLSGPYDPAQGETDSLDAEDSRRAWEGLVYLTTQQFGPDDDVVALVQVLAEDADTQESFGSQWPIGKIVRALNGRRGETSWNDDRVENAKRRLTKCIVRLRQAHGLDAIDLRALLARYAREHRMRSGQPVRTR